MTLSIEYICVVDFEATCSDSKPEPSPQELIEFPIVLYSVVKGQVVKTFHEYVKPHYHPHLTPFCTKFTGISQEMIDKASPFPEVFKRANAFLDKNGLSEKNALFVICGDWDLKTLLPAQCKLCNLAVNPIFKKWINIKFLYSRVFPQSSPVRGMDGLLQALNLKLEGHHHSGIDDSRNIARCLHILIEKVKSFNHASEMENLSKLLVPTTILGQTKRETKQYLASLPAFETTTTPPQHQQQHSSASTASPKTLQSGRVMGAWARPPKSSQQPPKVDAVAKPSTMAPPSAAMAKLIDIGCNLTHRAFGSAPTALHHTFAALEEGVVGVVITGASEKGSKQAQTLCHQFETYQPPLSQPHPHFFARPSLFFTAGVHPHDAKSFTEHTAERLAQLATDPHCVAVGESGLDYHRDFSPHEAQRRAFRKQLEIAVETQLPLFLHERDAFADMCAILNEFKGKLPPVVIHCFTSSEEALRKYIAEGFYIGLTGFITMKKRAAHILPALAHIPKNRLMLETDAPYMNPTNVRPRPRDNHPKYMKYILKAFVELVSDASTTPPASAWGEAEWGQQIYCNTLEFFRLEEQTAADGSTVLAKKSAPALKQQ